MKEISRLTFSASAFGLPSTLPSLDGFNRADLTPDAINRIPELNPIHAFDEKHYRTLALWWTLASKEPLYISGPSGSGKTSTAMQFCARLNVPVISVTARARMDRRELIGHWIVKNGQTVWQDGPAMLAWRNGWTLIINEFSTAPADMWVSLNDALEGQALDCSETGEVVPRHPNTRVIITDNTRGHSIEIDEGFYGRQIQDRSVIDRFWHLRMEAHSEALQSKLLFDGLPMSLREKFSESALKLLCEKLAKAGADSVASVGKEQLGFTSNAVALSFRALSRLRDMIVAVALDSSWNEGDEETLRRLIRISFTEALDQTAANTAETIISVAVGNTMIDTLRQSRNF